MIWLWLLVVVALSTAVVLLVWRVKTADERAARMESRLAALLEGQDAGLAVWDREGHLVACTQAVPRLLPDDTAYARVRLRRPHQVHSNPRPHSDR